MDNVRFVYHVESVVFGVITDVDSSRNSVAVAFNISDNVESVIVVKNIVGMVSVLVLLK